MGAARFTGLEFQKKWAAKALLALFDPMRVAMPMDNPGGVSATEFRCGYRRILELKEYPGRL